MCPIKVKAGNADSVSNLSMVVRKTLIQLSLLSLNAAKSDIKINKIIIVKIYNQVIRFSLDNHKLKMIFFNF